MKDIAWATSTLTPRQSSILDELRSVGLDHWSREFEYPWVLEHGNFTAKQWVLDAGGGNACCLLQYAVDKCGCHVINLDSDWRQFANNSPALPYYADIEHTHMMGLVFDRVLCVSVLEHVSRPLQVAYELHRILKIGGRLLLTMDVIDNRHDDVVPDQRHGVTIDTATSMANLFGLAVPAVPDDALTHQTDYGTLRVLCLFADKEHI